MKRSKKKLKERKNAHYIKIKDQTVVEKSPVVNNFSCLRMYVQ